MLQLKEFLQQKGAAKKLTGLIKHLADHPLVRVHDACKCVPSSIHWADVSLPNLDS